MSKNLLLLIAVTLITTGFILIVIGLGRNPLLWQAGVISVTLAMLTSVLSRWAKESEVDE